MIQRFMGYFFQPVQSKPVASRSWKPLLYCDYSSSDTNTAGGVQIGFGDPTKILWGEARDCYAFHCATFNHVCWLPTTNTLRVAKPYYIYCYSLTGNWNVDRNVNATAASLPYGWWYLQVA